MIYILKARVTEAGNYIGKLIRKMWIAQKVPKIGKNLGTPNVNVDQGALVEPIMTSEREDTLLPFDEMYLKFWKNFLHYRERCPHYNARSRWNEDRRRNGSYWKELQPVNKWKQLQPINKWKQGLEIEIDTNLRKLSSKNHKKSYEKINVFSVEIQKRWPMLK